MVKVLDLNDIESGKVEVKTFAAKLESVDWESYRGQDVQIKGCAPTWAHLLVAGRLFGKASKISFLLDDRSGAVPIEFYKS